MTAGPVSGCGLAVGSDPAARSAHPPAGLHWPLAGWRPAQAALKIGSAPARSDDRSSLNLQPPVAAQQVPRRCPPAAHPAQSVLEHAQGCRSIGAGRKLLAELEGFPCDEVDRALQGGEPCLRKR